MQLETYLDILVLGLATWRISHMIVWEDGPFEIFPKVNTFMSNWKFFDDLFSCVWCLSVWIGAILTLSAIIDKTVTIYLMLPFAFSAIAILLEQITDG